MNKRRYLLVVGIVAVAALISTLLYTVLANHGPVIASLVAEPDRVPPGGSCQIVCNATAPDGAALSYSWSATNGDITLTGEADTITWRAPNSSGSCNVTVIVSDSRGAEAKSSLIIAVDNPPMITSLAGNATWTIPLGTVEVTCVAADPDGDELSYEWMADGGHISGTGAAVNWTAPADIGAYNITVVVKDSYGAEALRELGLSVNLGTPPTIEKLIVTPVVTTPGKSYLRKSATPGCNFDVYESKAYTIECVASDASGELAYSWSPADEISGDGSAVTWTAPVTASSFKVTVTVTLSDVFGNSASESIVLWVSSCTCGSWPLQSGEVSF